MPASERLWRVVVVSNALEIAEDAKFRPPVLVCLGYYSISEGIHEWPVDGVVYIVLDSERVGVGAYPQRGHHVGKMQARTCFAAHCYGGGFFLAPWPPSSGARVSSRRFRLS
jgi:hypothetical protein